MIEYIIETYESWDEHGVFEFSFYDCVLRNNIGEFRKGQAVYAVYIDVDLGLVSIREIEGSDNEKRYTLANIEFKQFNPIFIS